MNLKLIIKQIIEFSSVNSNNVDQIIVNGDGSSNERYKIHKCATKYGLISTTVTEHQSINKYIVVSKKPLSDEMKKILIPTNQCKIDQITINDTMIWTFINLTKCPIPVPKPEYIEYYLKELNPYLGSYDKFIKYIHEVKDRGGIGEYRKHIDEITQAIVNYIKTDCSFEELRNCKQVPRIQKPQSLDCTVLTIDTLENKSETNNSERDRSRDLNRLKNTIYKTENHNKIMISIDLIDAFFKVIKYNYPATFEGETQWDQYISKYTDHRFLIESKILRKIILGKSGLGRQMTELCDRFMDEMLVGLTKVIEKESALLIINHNLDEIVIEVKDVGKDIKYLENLIKMYVDETYPNMFRTQIFRLHQLKDTLYFVKEMIGNDGEDGCKFKCCHPMVLMQCIKYWEKRECVANDYKYLKDDKIIDHRLSDHRLSDHPIVFG
jgi:hypothetical protein